MWEVMQDAPCTRALALKGCPRQLRDETRVAVLEDLVPLPRSQASAYQNFWFCRKPKYHGSV